MGTEIMRPYDCLTRSAHTPFPRRKANPNPNHHQRPSRKPSFSPRPEAKKRREGSPKPSTAGFNGNQLMMGQVTILKRGESLDAMTKRRAEPVASRRVSSGSVGGCWEADVFGTARLGPDPAMIPKQIRVVDVGRPDVFAGSAFGLSPSPRALPLPRFAANRSGVAPSEAAVDSSATQDLRRLLRMID